MRDLVAGAVAQPALGETFNTGQPPVVPARTSNRPRIAVSRTRPPAFVQALAEELDAELVPMGSAGVKVISVTRDVSDAYVHAGGQYEWDSAAPVAVARAAGLFTSRVDGSPLVYNQDNVSLPDLIVCRPELAEQIVEFVTAARRRTDRMTSYISHTTVDCANAYELSEWWKQVLDYVDLPDDPNEPGHEECMIQRPDGDHQLLFIEVPDAKSVKNRIHFDLRPSVGHPRRRGRAAAWHRARREVDDQRNHYGPGVGWVVLADPEGNEFCVLRSEAERGRRT